MLKQVFWLFVMFMGSFLAGVNCALLRPNTEYDASVEKVVLFILIYFVLGITTMEAKDED